MNEVPSLLQRFDRCLLNQVDLMWGGCNTISLKVLVTTNGAYDDELYSFLHWCSTDSSLTDISINNACHVKLIPNLKCPKIVIHKDSRCVLSIIKTLYPTWLPRVILLWHKKKHLSVMKKSNRKINIERVGKSFQSKLIDKAVIEKPMLSRSNSRFNKVSTKSFESKSQASSSIGLKFSIKSINSDYSSGRSFLSSSSIDSSDCASSLQSVDISSTLTEIKAYLQVFNEAILLTRSVSGSVQVELLQSVLTINGEYKADVFKFVSWLIRNTAREVAFSRLCNIKFFHTNKNDNLLRVLVKPDSDCPILATAYDWVCEICAKWKKFTEQENTQKSVKSIIQKNKNKEEKRVDSISSCRIKVMTLEENNRLLTKKNEEIENILNTKNIEIDNLKIDLAEAKALISKLQQQKRTISKFRLKPAQPVGLVSAIRTLNGSINDKDLLTDTENEHICKPAKCRKCFEDINYGCKCKYKSLRIDVTEEILSSLDDEEEDDDSDDDDDEDEDGDRMIGMIPFRDIRKSTKSRNTSLFKEVFTPSRKSAVLNQDSKRTSRQLENWFSNILQGPGIGSEDQTEYMIDSTVSLL